MNFTCPHCGQKTIPAAHKLGSTSATPAQCLNCGKLSSEPIESRALLVLFLGLAALVVFIYALTMSKLWPVYLYFCLAAVMVVLWFILVPLRPVTKEIYEREQKLKRALWIAIGVLVILGFGVGLFEA